MPITTSAKKALRGSAKKHGFNLKKKDQLTSAIKKIKQLVSDKKAKEAKAFFPQVQKIIDKAIKTNLIKKNTGARKKTRISAMIKNIK